MRYNKEVPSPAQLEGSRDASLRQTGWRLHWEGWPGRDRPLPASEKSAENAQQQSQR